MLRRSTETWPYAKERLREYGRKGDFAILRASPSTKHPETNHRMEIIDLRHKQ